MSYGYFKDLFRRATADKVLSGKLFYFAKNPKYDGYLDEIVLMIYRF